ncbi:hypothetical protein Bbelb_012300 [Branchiostoma belcheri]|nr:hypothetical protein Bbelb_012300 [Branchiostoma belcheri]
MAFEWNLTQHQGQSYDVTVRMRDAASSREGIASCQGTNVWHSAEINTWNCSGCPRQQCQDYLACVKGLRNLGELKQHWANSTQLLRSGTLIGKHGGQKTHWEKLL